MDLYFTFTRAQLKMMSAISSNFVVVWVVAMLGTRDFLTLTGNLVGVIISWYVGVKAEELLEEL